jgi:hypothetical protein
VLLAAAAPASAVAAPPIMPLTYPKLLITGNTRIVFRVSG